MSTFSVDSSEGIDGVVEAVNYLLATSNTQTVSNVGNVANSLVANTTTGTITTTADPNFLAYLYQYIAVRYADNNTGSSNFTTSPTNRLYYGIRNSTSSVGSSNPTDYVWTEVVGGFGTSKFLFYQVSGGRQLQLAVDTAVPSAGFLQTQDNVSIDLDTITSLAGNIVTNVEIADNTITGNKIVDATLTGNLIANSTISGNNIANSTITGSLIANLTITDTLIANSAITTDKIAANAVTANQIAAATITADEIASNTITANNIATGTITANQIAADTITANNIATGTITTTEIAANTILADNIAGGTITADKLAANVLTVNTVVSDGATLGSNTSVGFWLEGNTGNARFGNGVSIGDDLTVGDDAVIGGNLTITGLISGGTLDDSTVNTTVISNQAVSVTVGDQNPFQYTVFYPSANTVIPISNSVVLTTTVANSVIVVTGRVNQSWVVNLSGGSDSVNTNVFITMQQILPLPPQQFILAFDDRVITGVGTLDQQDQLVVEPSLRFLLPNIGLYSFNLSTAYTTTGNANVAYQFSKQRSVTVTNLKR